MPDTRHAMPRQSVSSQDAWLWLSWSIVVAVCAKFEWQRLQIMLDNGAGVLAWATGFWNNETTLPLIVLLSLPLLWLIARTRLAPPQPRSAAVDSDSGDVSYQASTRQRCWSMLAIFALSLLCSIAVGSRPVTIRSGFDTETIRFAELPPAYHDEFSYLLQARTFLDGRLSYPPAPVRPDLFHQFHVLNDHRTASRYFPFTGLWITPFLALGHPVWGHWLAGALSAAFFYLSAVQIVSQRAALTAGVLVAISPGLAIFSNLLLAHHPTMLALSVFCWAILRMRQSGRPTFAIIAGCGLALAMLGRPMTAAGFALPFGIAFAGSLLRSGDRRRTVWKCAAGMALPLLAAFAALAVMNQNITGSPLTSGYQTYTETFTPSHRYGFNNAAHNELSSARKPVPEAIVAYDRWAADANLTPSVAMNNTANRIFASAVWSLGIAPLLFGLLLVLPLLFAREDSAWGSTPQSGPADASQKNPPTTIRRRGLRLLACSIVTLHLVHVPYWFVGIMHWHYVFETAPLLLLLTGTGLTSAGQTLRRHLPPRAAVFWLFSFVAASAIPAWFTSSVFSDVSKIDAAVSELAFSKTRIEQFRRIVNSGDVGKPALVLVDESGTDFQLSYIINPPDYSGPVLVCRKPGTPAEVRELQRAFPDRNLYTFDPASFSVAQFGVE